MKQVLLTAVVVVGLFLPSTTPPAAAQEIHCPSPSMTAGQGWKLITLFADGQSRSVDWDVSPDGKVVTSSGLHSRKVRAIRHDWYLNVSLVKSCRITVQRPIFRDGFETGDTSAWSNAP